MEFQDVVRRRKMVRSFTDEPVKADVVRRILDVARRGPSAGFSQGVEFVVVTDAATRRTIAGPAEDVVGSSGHRNFVAQAPVQVVVCVSPEVYRARYREPDKMKVVAGVPDEILWGVPWWYTDAGAALQLLLLAAVDEGIGAAFIGAYGGVVADLLGIPDDYVPVGIALLGHPAPDAGRFGDISAQPRARRGYDDIVHHERW